MALLITMVTLAINSNNDGTPLVLPLLLLQINTGLWGTTIFSGTAPMWTLAVEFQFYLVLPLLLLILKRNGVQTFCAMIAVLLAFKAMILILYPDVRLYYSSIGRFDHFLSGMVAGWLFVTYKDKLINGYVSVMLQLLILLLIGLFMFYYHSDHPVGKQLVAITTSSFEAILWSIFILFYTTCKLNCPAIVDKGLSMLGSISFSIYLLHMPIHLLIIKMINNTGLVAYQFIVLVTLGTLATIVFSSLTYCAVEKPFMSLKKPYRY